jgi:hypothetical protein
MVLGLAVAKRPFWPPQDSRSFLPPDLSGRARDMIFPRRWPWAVADSISQFLWIFGFRRGEMGAKIRDLCATRPRLHGLEARPDSGRIRSMGSRLNSMALLALTFGVGLL